MKKVYPVNANGLFFTIELPEGLGDAYIELSQITGSLDDIKSVKSEAVKIPYSSLLHHILTAKNELKDIDFHNRYYKDLYKAIGYED